MCKREPRASRLYQMLHIIWPVSADDELVLAGNLVLHDAFYAHTNGLQIPAVEEIEAYAILEMLIPEAK